MLGAKIDARLNALERRLTDISHRLERLEKPPAQVELPVVVLPLDLPKRRGRPPKVKNV